jgi:hypothetical protein
MGLKKRKRSAVRMMEQLLRILIRPSTTTMSERETGRSAANLQKYLRVLKKLAEKDPDEKFWDILHRVDLKILKHLLQFKR